MASWYRKCSAYANQNHNEKSPHTCQNGYLQKDKNKGWQQCREKGSTMYCFCGSKFLQPPWKTLWRFLKKSKIELACACMHA